MPIPRIAIVGRPNAGKSSLLNMIAGKKVSIVDPTPGVTRDRVAAIVDLEHPDGPGGGPFKAVEFIDTGGFGVYTAEGARFDEVGADLANLTKDIEGQIAAAIETADVVLFAVDAQAGVTPADEQIAKLLREGKLGRSTRKGHGPRGKGGKGKAEKDAKGKGRGKSNEEDERDEPADAPATEGQELPPLSERVKVIATKVDGPKWEAHAHELSGLGFGEPMMCSAKNNYMRRDLADALYNMLPKPTGAQSRPIADLMVAIIGKRNAGKSTLVNTLAGEPRMIVSEIAGTTRDAVDVRFELEGRSLVAIDTAGLRRKKSFQNMVEWYALDRAERAIHRAQVILLIIDSTTKLSQVDEQLAMMCQKAYKPAIIVINKWDEDGGALSGVTKKGTTPRPEEYETYIRRELKGLSHAPIAFMSAKQGLNVRETMHLAFDLQQQAGTRVTTGVLNRLVRRLIARRAPTDKIGSHAKIYFVAQTGTHPPTIHLVVNKPELFRPGYQRFLVNGFREELPFSEVPIKLIVRPRREGGPELKGPALDTLVARAGAINPRGRTVKNTGLEESLKPTSEIFDETYDLGDDAAKYFEEELSQSDSAVEPEVIESDVEDEE
jgi:GTPase